MSTRYKKLITGCYLIMTGMLFAGKLPPHEQVIENYGNMQYPRARKLSNEYSKLPESRLVMALCAVFDRKKQDLSYGLPELKSIYENPAIKLNLRLQAGLAYARAAQTLQMRKGIYTAYDNIDFNAIYDSIMKNHLNRPEACFAVVYKAQWLLESADKKKRAKAFALLENFLRSYKGPMIFLSAVNILLADQYIINYRNYRKSVKYLINALNCGVSNPRTRELILFRIARTYDLKLKDKISAMKYYREFLQKYPNSSNTPVIKRYLHKLSSKTMEVKND